MFDDQLKGPLDLQYKPNNQPQASPTETPSQPKPEVGPSSLVGRRGDNMTFHTQGASKKGYFNLIWGWAWKDLAAAFLGLLRLFLPTKRR